MPLDLEHHRREAKRLIRSFRAGEEAALARAEAVLGGRERERFVLADAQHVVARELGYRSWPELRRVQDEVEERVVDTGRVYRPGEPVRVVVRARPRRWMIDDDGAAVRLAGKPPGWLEAAERLVAEDGLNVSRRGVVFVPTVYPDWIEPLTARIGEASLALYEELLDMS